MKRSREFAEATQTVATIWGKQMWVGDFAKVATIIPLGVKTASRLNRRPIFMWGNKVGETIAKKIQKGYEDEAENSQKFS